MDEIYIKNIKTRVLLFVNKLCLKVSSSEGRSFLLLLVIVTLLDLPIAA